MRNIAITTAAEQPVSAMTLSSTPKSVTGTIRLLIADDQPIILRGLSLMLGSEADIDVVGLARDGVEVVEMANDLSPDVIICLLYTSPSPRDGLLSRMPSSA